MKLLHWERGGFVVYYKRLSHGRFHSKIFLRTGIGFRSMRWDEDVDIGGKRTFFYYHKGSRAGEIPRSQLKRFKGKYKQMDTKKLPAVCRKRFQNGKMPPQTAGAFSRMGIPSCRLHGRFPELELLPVDCRGIFQNGNGFLQTAGK